ncbi:hypothetical protein B0T16DRAFT_455095 [Cercophora newfieldiana]|uniref:Uncharacterized protein n=1 Tax=Cercophora newfieldiana TaxID=92897 RepID=A0AA39YJJ4_9PEZI|nr:hypothetical protein B0T16DRAFT_455095 [Cercophora newfieldiana]
MPENEVPSSPSGGEASNSDPPKPPTGSGWFAGLVLRERIRRAEREQTPPDTGERGELALMLTVLHLQSWLQHSQLERQSTARHMFALHQRLEEQQKEHQRQAPQNNDVERLKKVIRQQELQVQALQQSQDHRAYFEIKEPPRDQMQQRLQRLRMAIQDWAGFLLKDAATAPIGRLFKYDPARLGQYPSEARDLVVHPGSSNRDLEFMNPSLECAHFVAAVASHIVVKEGVASPLGGCTPQFKNGLKGELFDTMSTCGYGQGGYRRLAKIWRAMCLRMYNSTIGVPNDVGYRGEKEKEAQNHKDRIMSVVRDTLQPLIDMILGLEHSNVFDDPECRHRLESIIAESVEIGRILGELASDLVVIDGEWFHRAADEAGFNYRSDLGAQVEFRSASEGDPLKGKDKARIAVILFPGLIKYDTGYEGDNWQNWSVWIPASIQLATPEEERGSTPESDSDPESDGES